jgi:hypothetical protein
MKLSEIKKTIACATSAINRAAVNRKRSFSAGSDEAGCTAGLL